MGMWPLNRYRNREQGLTLIEVLIALAIASIALTAVIKATSQNIRATSYLYDKTIALWISQTLINEARLDLRHFTEDNRITSLSFLGETWYWQGKETSTPNKHIHHLSVSVYKKEEDETALMTLESYRYYAK